MSKNVNETVRRSLGLAQLFDSVSENRRCKPLIIRPFLPKATGRESGAVGTF